MDKTSNKLQVEILSASNVLSNFSNSNKIASYLTTKNAVSPLNYDFGKNTPTTQYGSPKSTLNAKFLEENNKPRGFSAEASSLISSTKKESEGMYFLKSPLLSSTDSKKNFSFNNFMNENEAKKFDFDQKLKSMKYETGNRSDVTSANFKLIRNNSMNKLANNKTNLNETIDNQKTLIRKVMEKQNCDINIFSPKTFLLNNAHNNNNYGNNIINNFGNAKDGMMMSPKSTKMEQVYEQIKLFQSNRKKKEDSSSNERHQQSMKNSEEKKSPYKPSQQTIEKKETFIKVLNETSNIVNSMKPSNNRNDFANKMKMLSPLKGDDVLVSATPNNLNSKLFRKNEDFDKIYNEYHNNTKLVKKPNYNQNFLMAKENEKNHENPKIQQSNHQEKDLEKSTDETNEYKRLQEKLNVLEKKILSIKSNYDFTLKKNEKHSETKKLPTKKNDFVSSSCNFYEASSKDKEKYAKDTPSNSNGPTHKPKKISLEINNSNTKNMKYSNSEIETSKKSKTKTKEENSPLNRYVTQVKPHSIFPNNVYEDIFPKTLNISEISIKNENNGRETPKNYSNNNNKRHPATNTVKASVMKLLFKSEIYYIGSVVKAFFQQKNSEQEIWKEHFHQTMQAILFTKFLKYPDDDAIEAKKINLSKKDYYRNKKTLIFDLDETLIHCNENCEMESDVILPVKFPNGAIVQAGINLRPGIKECLKELSKYYEIIVFTASHSCYANVVLNYLDPQNEFIQHKLSRENCIVTKEGLYIKDLRILKNRELRDLVIIDNAAYSFGFQLENGIPILPFYKDKNDSELKSLTNYLLILKDVQDLREMNNEIFKMSRYCEFNDPYDLIKSLYTDYYKS